MHPGVVREDSRVEAHVAFELKGLPRHLAHDPDLQEPRPRGPEPWKLVIPQAVFITLFVYVMFDQMLTIPWPPTLIGEWVPALKGVIPSM